MIEQELIVLKQCFSVSLEGACRTTSLIKLLCHVYWHSCVTSLTLSLGKHVIRRHSDGKLRDTDREYEQTMKLCNPVSLGLVFKSLPEENEYI